MFRYMKRRNEPPTKEMFTEWLDDYLNIHPEIPKPVLPQPDDQHMLLGQRQDYQKFSQSYPHGTSICGEWGHFLSEEYIASAGETYSYYFNFHNSKSLCVDVIFFLAIW